MSETISTIKLKISLILILVLFPGISLPNSELRLSLDVAEYRLNNGLQVLILEDHAIPVVSVQVWVKVGSRDDSSGRTGISHLVEHMVFRGTPDMGPGKYLRMIQRHGGFADAFTNLDMTVYFSVMPSSQLELVLKMEADRMVNAVFEPAEFEKVRSVVMEERRQQLDSPVSLLTEELKAMAFKVHPYRYPVIGWMSDLANMDMDEVKKHYKTYYVPENLTLIIVGDVVKEKAMSLVRKYFEALHKRQAQPRSIPAEPRQQGEKRLIIERDINVPLLAIAYHIPRFGEEDIFTLDVIWQILAAGRSSRLYKKLVYEKKLATTVEVYFDYAVYPGLITFYVALQKGHEPLEVERALLEELNLFQKEPVDDREIRKAINGTLSYFISQQQSVLDQGIMLGWFNVLGDYGLIDGYIERLSLVTKNDIMRVANKYLVATNMTVAYMVPKGIKGGVK